MQKTTTIALSDLREILEFLSNSGLATLPDFNETAVGAQLTFQSSEPNKTIVLNYFEDLSDAAEPIFDWDVEIVEELPEGGQ